MTNNPSGYLVRFDGRFLSGYSLGDIWRDFAGCAGVTIVAPNGRMVLANAGSVSTRAYEVHSRYNDQRVARRIRRYLATTEQS